MEGALAPTPPPGLFLRGGVAPPSGLFSLGPGNPMRGVRAPLVEGAVGVIAPLRKGAEGVRAPEVDTKGEVGELWYPS